MLIVRSTSATALPPSVSAAIEDIVDADNADEAVIDGIDICP